ncbi:MAG: endonuclease III [Desulfuromonas sp.]|nr:MAG: endonuclease III [Desulfuromonas sp.]
MEASQSIPLWSALKDLYPDVRCALDYKSPWQLLVATILSAQCTDKRVNLVTPELFQRFPGPEQLAAATRDEVEAIIRSTGFFRNKAKNLIACAQTVSAVYGGDVPRTLEQLVNLPGVGRKTANVVLGNVFNTPGMVVDTHVKRLARRFGWTTRTDPVKIEQELMCLLPREDWTPAGHTLIAHGRAYCKAPVPVCSACPVITLCPRIGVGRSR